MTDPNRFPEVEPVTDEEALRRRQLEAGANLSALLCEIDAERDAAHLVEGVQALRQSEQDGNRDAMDAFADKIKGLGRYE